MSGGHFNYCQYHVANCLTDFGCDKQMRERFPNLANRLCALSGSLSKILHDIDWDFSDDGYIDDDEAFENDAINRLIRAVTHPTPEGCDE